ncbi:MAG: OmpA family protein [Phycisphaerae bacterium]|nr:OmpA family protein [Phycisphaerae bacterium]
MARHWALGMIALVMGAGNLGCYYDQWQNAERDNRILREDLSRTKQDLADCESMNAQKDTMIDALNKQIAAKNEQIGTLTAEAEHLRQALSQAQAILEAQAGKGLQPVTIMKTQALPEPLHKALQALAEQFPDQIEYLPDKGAVRWKSDLLFPLGSDEIAGANEAGEALRKFAEIVIAHAAEFDVVVVGHTCTTPIRRAETLARFPTNWYLSAGRSIRVMELLGQQGVPMTQMGIMGYGEYRPIADNNTNEGKAKNRRVEIFLVSRGAIQSMSMGVYQAPDQGLAFLHGRDVFQPE